MYIHYNAADIVHGLSWRLDLTQQQISASELGSNQNKPKPTLAICDTTHTARITHMNNFVALVGPSSRAVSVPDHKTNC